MSRPALRRDRSRLDPYSHLFQSRGRRTCRAHRRSRAEAAPRIWIGTFHAFGLDLVRRYHEQLELSPDPTLFDRSDAIEVLEEILPTLPLVHYRNLWDPAMELRDVVAAISRAKDEMADPTRYRTLAQAMLDRAEDDETRTRAEKCLEVARIYELYEQAIRDRGSVDFGDLIMRPALLLESNQVASDRGAAPPPACSGRRVSGRESSECRLLKAIAGDGKRLWVVGDSRQSIYRFRGASSSNMAAFASDYQCAISDQLLINYRSTGKSSTPSGHRSAYGRVKGHAAARLHLPIAGLAPVRSSAATTRSMTRRQALPPASANLNQTASAFATRRFFVDRTGA